MKASAHLCSICVRRPAIGWDVIDGKRRPCCFECVEGEVVDVYFNDDADRPASTRRVLHALWNFPNSTLDELREMLGIPGNSADPLAYDRLMRSVSYLNKTGRLTTVKTVNDFGMPVFAYAVAPQLRFRDLARRQGRPRKEAA